MGTVELSQTHKKDMRKRKLSIFFRTPTNKLLWKRKSVLSALKFSLAQLAGAVEYTDCTSAEG